MDILVEFEEGHTPGLFGMAHRWPAVPQASHTALAGLFFTFMVVGEAIGGV